MKVKREVIEATCDRCKAVGDTGSTEGHNQWGEMNVAYKGHSGGRTVMGDAGGINHAGRAWLCMRCAADFLAFLAGKETPHD